MKEIKVFGKPIIEDKVITQLQNCMVEDSIGVLTADAHYGYSMPVGGCIAYKHLISPSGVGFDIGCGNMAVQTNVLASDINVPLAMTEIFRQISFGVGRPNNEPVEAPVLEQIRNADFVPQRGLLQLAAAQLGTVGSGNHYIDLFEDENGFLWIGVHFGSRGFGHKTAMGFLALSQGGKFGDKASDGAMDSKPTLFDTRTELGAAYVSAMQLAGEYAYSGRRAVVAKVQSILGIMSDSIVQTVHNHHNFAWKENHFGEDYWVVRKGCTPAFPGQSGFIGANMRDNSVIVEGVDSAEAASGLYSTVHGAGRIMSRTQAAGKKKWIADEQGIKRPTTIAAGQVNFDEVKAQMRNSNIELRGAGADEAPQCYKTLEEVLKYQGDTIKIKHTLRPIGIAMAGSDTIDPYKD